MMGNYIDGVEAPDLSSCEENECEELCESAINDCDKVCDSKFAHESALVTDAVDLKDSLYWKQNLNNINLVSLKDFEENHLEEYEKISLMFLLNDNCDEGLKSVYSWAQKVSQHPDWRKKLLEALAIIQNYQIPKMLGFSKIQLRNEFFPSQYFTSQHVNLFRKIVYLVCENFSCAEEKAFLNRVKNDFNKKGFVFLDFPHLESYFEYFIKIGYISEYNVSNCSRILKNMEMDKAYEMLTFKSPLLASGSRNVSADDTNLGGPCSINQSNFLIKTPDKIKDDIYDTRKNKVALIIDQENFYSEINEEFKHLLPKGIEKDKLKSREGTLHDSQRLEKTLKQRNFNVITKRNLTHLRMVAKLREAVGLINKNNCSLFLVTILSHGDRGVVYGVNSCFVEVSEIIKILSDKNLNDIPKVLILQSCQGQSLQTVTKDDNLETDGPSVIRTPELTTRDFIIFWSTVPGFGSIRDKQRGTWFIQSLCNQIDKHGDSDHFEEICLRIKGDLSKMKWKKDSETECFMVPINESTLSKKLYL